MIQAQSRALSASTESALQRLQAEIDALPTYADQVAAAAKRFKSASAGRTFADVRQMLASMSPGNSRCMLCEDSAANEIDHLLPKSLYPCAVFFWLNLINSCGVCNKSKGSRFAVYAASTGEFVDVTRKRKAPIVRPVEGTPVLIDPRREDPTRFLWLDITTSFYFAPIASLGPRDHERARYTIELLKLNGRDALVRQRRQHFSIYASHLEAYQHAKVRGATDVELVERRDKVRTLAHPAVWHEIRRQHGRHPRLRGLFEASPEALLWDSTPSATKRWLSGDEP